MTRIMLLALAAAVLCAAVPAQEEAAQTVTIKHRAPKAGDSAGLLSKSVSDSTTTVVLDGEARPAMTMKRTRMMRKKSEVMGAGEGGVNKVKVTYTPSLISVRMKYHRL